MATDLLGSILCAEGGLNRCLILFRGVNGLHYYRPRPISSNCVPGARETLPNNILVRFHRPSGASSV